MPGFPLQLFLADVSKCICVVCRRVVKEPWQTDSGDRYCKTCETPNSPRRLRAYYDKATDVEVQALRVKCTDVLCRWTGTLKNYLDHCHGRQMTDRLQFEHIQNLLEQCARSLQYLNNRIHQVRMPRPASRSGDRMTRGTTSDQHPHQHRHQRLALELAEQDLRIQALELASYDGVLTWKISDFFHKRYDAIRKKTTSFYSPCFYTSRTGYKMCAQIYLNGDGMGKGTHVSLFFVVMRGRYDGLLHWPFRQQVTFMLLDQNNRQHVTDAFRPDPTSSSFQRPTSDMNIASGCPLFVPLSQLESTRHAYVRDDTMFIKVIVDTSDLC